MEVGVIVNKYPQHRSRVKFVYDLGAGLCPVTKEPLSSIITVEYEPTQLLVEARQVPKMIASMQNEPMDMETLVQIIAGELSTALQATVYVRGEFILSGGVSLDVETTAYILRR